MPLLPPDRFRELLESANLKELFNELGWDHPTLGSRSIRVEQDDFTLTQLAQKKDVGIFLCSSDKHEQISERPLLLKIDKEAAKIAHERLLIFANKDKSQLTWLWTSRNPRAVRTHTWSKGQSIESLRQKLELIVFTLDDEEGLLLSNVIVRLRDAFDRDRLSKTFYENFKQQHDVFGDFITGLQNAAERQWYASLMLNRLMFVYFIQKKGFLDDDPDYLKNRLTKVQQQAGKGKFHSFYRQFLRLLFHEGFGTPEEDRAPDLSSLIGNIPYLNGGLFDPHKLEDHNPKIDIPDEAFESLFAFFDRWDWHLDDRPLSSGREINPDVLGYIFEKYINQKQMGAYYTKEDITEYISKNTVIPHLLERARERCKVAFDGEASVWNLLKADPDRYFYPAMKTGVIDKQGGIVPESALPDFVQTGMKEAKARMFDKRYNLGEAIFTTAAGERGTLPTETWREYVDRRGRCLAVRERLAKGEIKSIDDLITLNLDIRQFMQDVIDTATSPDLLRAVWQAIVGRVPEKSNEKFRHGIAILDPTCGSGAFLFAALNVLEPLYEACLDRMEGFVEDAKKLGKAGEADFVRVLAEVDRHPSRRYYIYKNIILHNLFGVDIMPEAVEICKLRLFLKLVSQVDSGRELEPLPDIDFNIRAGNTLVGYATEAQFDKASEFFNSAHRADIKASIADLSDSFDFFRKQQTNYSQKPPTAADKKTLHDRLTGLSLELDKYLAREYGIDSTKKKEFAAWQKSHQPFHWFAEFYGVMREGGFDVVIGNPPYVEYKDVKSTYQIRGYRTEDCGDLYAFVMERSRDLLSSRNRLGMIVPVSIVSTDGFKTLRECLIHPNVNSWCSAFAERPSKLFTGVEKRLAIWICNAGHGGNLFVSRYHRWLSEERENLFSCIHFIEKQMVADFVGSSLPKISTKIESDVLEKISVQQTLKLLWVRGSQNVIYYTRKVRYFIQFFNFIPEILDEKSRPIEPSELNTIELSTTLQRDVVLSTLNSGLFFWFFNVYSDVRNVNRREIDAFRCSIAAMNPEVAKKIQQISVKLIQDFKANAAMITNNYKKYGKRTIQTFRPRQSKPVIDEIDQLLAQHYGLTNEETDFIINYDIKYRMGDADSDNEE
jgi:type I restriction-modification system DNA methylase subunit